MNVVHCMPDIDKEASGPTYSVVRLCESLIDLGDSSSIALVGRSAEKPFIRAFPAGIGPARLGRSPAMLRWLKQQARARRVDVFHDHSLWMMPNVYPGWATKGTGIPYVVSPRGTLSAWAMRSGSKVKRLFWPLLQRPSIRHAACFHATAESEYEDIRRMGFKQPVAIIPNGIDLPEYRPKVDRARRILLFLGRLHPIKGVDHLLRCWLALQVSYPEWDLRIVGPDDTEHAIAMKNLARQLGLERVHFAGPIYGDEKFDAYRQADLYVLPTHSENFGVTVAEALACGTPAIVGRGAPWHGIESEDCGWWVNNDTQTLTATLEEAMQKSDQELQVMGLRGRAWMEREYGWASIAERMSATYQWLLDGGTAPSFIVHN